MSDVRGVWSLQRVRTASHTSQSCRAEGRTAGIHLKGTHRRNRSHRVSYTVQIELVALARVRGKDVLATLCVKLSQKEAALRYLTCGIPSMSSTSMTSMHIISIHFYSFLFISSSFTSCLALSGVRRDRHALAHRRLSLPPWGGRGGVRSASEQPERLGRSADAVAF